MHRGIDEGCCCRMWRRLSVQLPILHHSYMPAVGGISASTSSLGGSSEAFVHYNLMTTSTPPESHSCWTSRMVVCRQELGDVICFPLFFLLLNFSFNFIYKCMCKAWDGLCTETQSLTNQHLQEKLLLTGKKPPWPGWKSFTATV